MTRAAHWWPNELRSDTHRASSATERFVRPSIRHVWVALTLAAAFIGPASSPIGVPDIFWTLLGGAWMASHHALLETDPFTSAPHLDGPILNVQWLAQLAYHALDALGGVPLVITGTAA